MKRKPKKPQTDDPSQPPPLTVIEQHQSPPIVIAAADTPEETDLSVESSDASDKMEAACADVRQRHQTLVMLGRRSIEQALELGALLASVKARLPHGKWYQFLENAEVGTRASQNYLHLHNHRDEVRSKSALSADLTIIGSLKAIRSSKTKPATFVSAEETKAAETLSTPGKGGKPPVQSENGIGSNPPATSREEVGGHKAQEIGADVPSVETQDENPKVDEVVADGGKSSANDAADDSVEVGSPGACGPQVAPTCESADARSVSDEMQRFRSVDGTQWPPDSADDGLIPFSTTQGEINLLNENNERLSAEHKRPLTALRLAEAFVVELARTVNRVSRASEATEEETMVMLNDVTTSLRNFTNTSTAVTRRQMRVAELAASQRKSAHSNSA